MGILNRIKKAFGTDDAQGKPPQASALPSLEEIHDRIVKAKLNFRQALSEAEIASKKSQAIYAKLWDVTPGERAELRKQKAEVDAMIRRKLDHAQAFAKSLASLQDVEIVMQIDQAFTQCGLVDSASGESMSLQDIQRSLEEAALVVARTMESVEKLGISIAAPGAHTVSVSEEERELEELWAAFDREPDPVRKEEIKHRIQEKEAPPQMALAAGGV